MTQLLVKQISEEELKKHANRIWLELNERTKDNWGRTENSSEIESLVRREALTVLKDEIKKIIETEEFKEEQHKAAVEVVNKIIEETKRKMIEEVSNRLAGVTVDSRGISLKFMIEQVVIDMMNRR